MDSSSPSNTFGSSSRQCGVHRLDNGRTTWRVWVPLARQVELILLDGDRSQAFPMQNESGGYYSCARSDVAAGQRYAFKLDDRPPRPDPYSLWQPDGVHAASAVYFPDEFAWTDQAWRGIAREDLVIYELHIGTFTPEGTFDAVIPRLADLRDLGVTALEIMPIAQFAGPRNWGYDGVNLFAPQNNYGGPAALQRLVDAAHAHGLAVFLDVVYNHFGPEGNYISEFGPYYSDRYRTPWGPAFNFDGRGSDPVRNLVLDNVRHWIGDFHFDGLRLDAVHAMFDISPTHILAEVKEVADVAAKEQNRTAIIIVESLMNDVRMVLPTHQGGYGCDAEWNEDFHHALLAYLTGERHGKYVDFGPVDHLPIVLENTFLLSGGYSQFRGRRWGRPARGLPGDQFVIGIQNHDHIGNRARGERLAALVSPAAQRMAASLMLLSPHLPLLFMGEEYGEERPFMFFCSFGDEQLIANVRAGRRRDYALIGEVPDPQDEATMAASRLSWSWPDGTYHAGLRRLYADLIAARRDWPALRNWRERSAKLWPGVAEGAVLQLVRGGKTAGAPATITAWFNLTGQPQPLPAEASAGSPPLLSTELRRYQGLRDELSGRIEQLLPFECLVWGGGNDQ